VITKLVKESGVSRTTLHYLINNRKGVGPKTAAKIADAAEKLGISLDVWDCLYPQDSSNPIFKGKRA